MILDKKFQNTGMKECDFLKIKMNIQNLIFKDRNLKRNICCRNLNKKKWNLLKDFSIVKMCTIKFVKNWIR